MAWIIWHPFRALTVSVDGQLNLGSPDVSAIVVPHYRPILAATGEWIAYVHDEANAVLYAYNANAIFNSLAGTTGFDRDVRVSGTLFNKSVASVYGRGPTNGAVTSNHNLVSWFNGGPGIVDVTWAPFLNAPVVLVTAESGASVVVATVANVTNQSCRIVCAQLSGTGVDCLVNMAVFGQ